MLYLDTGMITDLNVLDQRATCYNDTSTLVTSNKWKLGCQWPVTIDGVKICVANSRVFDVDEYLIWAGLCNCFSIKSSALVYTGSRILPGICL